MGILHTVFLSRETHRINIELSRVAKTYAFGSKLYFGSFLWRFSHTVFLSRETHRINIELSRVAKTYAFATKLYEFKLQLLF